MVSHEQPSSAIDAKDVFDGDKGKQAIRDFMDQHHEMLSQQGNFLGGWHDPDSGKIFLDISTNVQDRAEAIALGQKNNQISIYDVENGTTVDTGGTGGLDSGT